MNRWKYGDRKEGSKDVRKGEIVRRIEKGIGKIRDKKRNFDLRY